MTESDALDFLRRHQPLPPDDLLNADLIDTYDAVRRLFRDHPNDECVGLFLHSFGDGTGLGVYQLVEDTLRAHEDDLVVAELTVSLRAPESSVRYWSAQIAQNYPDPRLGEPLLALLMDEDPGIRAAAIVALWGVGDPADRARIKSLRRSETDEEVVDAIDMLED